MGSYARALLPMARVVRLAGMSTSPVALCCLVVRGGRAGRSTACVVVVMVTSFTVVRQVVAGALVVAAGFALPAFAAAMGLWLLSIRASCSSSECRVVHRGTMPAGDRRQGA